MPLDNERNLLHVYPEIDLSTSVLNNLSSSYLYCLEPVALGTPYIESLTSYIMRLSEAHVLSPRRLLFGVLLEELDRPYLLNDTNTVFKRAHAINGMAAWARDFVSVLGELTCQTGLEKLTMLKWVDVLSSRSMFNDLLYYCPQCYQEFFDDGGELHNPLIWSFRHVQYCLKHQCLLQDQCPKCHRGLPVLNKTAWIGYCTYCGVWLGKRRNNSVAYIPDKNPEDFEQQQWDIEQIENLVVWGQKHGKLPSQQDFIDAMLLVIDVSSPISRNQLSKYLGISRRTISDWIEGNQLPTLGYLLRVCHFLDVPVVEFLTNSAEVIDHEKFDFYFKDHEEIRSSPNPKWKVDFDLQATRLALEGILSDSNCVPPSMVTVSVTLGIDQSFLINQFPKLTRAISDRYAVYRKVKAERRIESICSEIKQAVLYLHEDGIYPSYWKVRKQLAKPWQMNIPEAYLTWQVSLTDLGYS